MTLTNTKAALGLATVILTIVSIIGGAVTRLETRFAALDTRLGKLESAIRTMNVTTPDERYKQLIKELIAQERSEPVGSQKPDAIHRFAKDSWNCVNQLNGCTFPADAGAAADAPAVKVPQ